MKHLRVTALEELLLLTVTNKVWDWVIETMSRDCKGGTKRQLTKMKETGGCYQSNAAEYNS